MAKRFVAGFALTPFVPLEARSLDTARLNATEVIGEAPMLRKAVREAYDFQPSRMVGAIGRRRDRQGRGLKAPRFVGVACEGGGRSCPLGHKEIAENWGRRADREIGVPGGAVDLKRLAAPRRSGVVWAVGAGNIRG